MESTYNAILNSLEKEECFKESNRKLLKIENELKKSLTPDELELFLEYEKEALNAGLNACEYFYCYFAL